MNIRPIDMQVLIPRATDVGKMQQQSNEQPILQQQQFAEQLRQLTDQKQQQVQRTPRSEGGKVSERKPKEQKRDDNKEQHQSEQKTKSDSLTSQESIEHSKDGLEVGHFVDIKT